MTLERTIKDGKLGIVRGGTIYSDLGSIRGINPIAPCPFAQTSLKATIVKYVSSEEIPGVGKSHGEFVFYEELPEDIEGWDFILRETYPKDDEREIPVSQELFVFGPNLNWKTFEFPEK